MNKRLLPLLAPVAALLAAVGVWGTWSPEGAPAVVKAEGSGAPGFPIKNPIDRYVLEKLQENKLEPSGVCSDEEFCRRAFLDIVGMIPTPFELRNFLNDRSSLRRQRLVENLLKDPRYGNKWAVVWGDLLREHSNGRRQEGTVRGSFRDWIKDALNDNVPYNKFVTDLICANGRAEDNGAVNFFLRDENDRVETVNMVSNVFMGSRMACAQCHDHPFDKWEQKDFHSLMAFLNPRTSVQLDQAASLANLKNARVPADIMAILKPYIEKAEKEVEAEDDNGGAMGAMGNMNGGGMGKNMARKGGGLNLRQVEQEVEKKLGREKAERLRQIFQGSQIRKVVERPIGDYRMPTEGDSADKRAKNSGEIVEPVFPWDPELKAAPRASRREALAKFVTESRRFAEVQVNRVWQQIFGRGIVDPVDDFREKNPPTHPELLKFLADEFVRAKFDNKALIKLILTSSTYERSSVPTASNKEDTQYYSHYRIRRMTAEQIFDSILVATGRTDGLAELGKPRQAVQAMDAGGGRKGGAPKGAKVDWAVDLPTPARNGTFMNLFNQPDREQIVTERDRSGSISQALELLNGQAINGAVQAKPGTLSRELLDAKKDGIAIATELYLSTLSRYPTKQELDVAKIVLRGAPPEEQTVEDFHWALLNTREFMFVK
ncbi:MAG: DUF1549 domain-containing protein [Planctomycetota bacterium]|nr:DUF1549 domain-containing protein [Planctomycetota bacterium]